MFRKRQKIEFVCETKIPVLAKPFKEHIEGLEMYPPNMMLMIY